MDCSTTHHVDLCDQEYSTQVYTVDPDVDEFWAISRIHTGAQFVHKRAKSLTKNTVKDRNGFEPTYVNDKVYTSKLIQAYLIREQAKSPTKYTMFTHEHTLHTNTTHPRHGDILQRKRHRHRQSLPILVEVLRADIGRVKLHTDTISPQIFVLLVGDAPSLRVLHTVLQHTDVDDTQICIALNCAQPPTRIQLTRIHTMWRNFLNLRSYT